MKKIIAVTLCLLFVFGCGNKVTPLDIPIVEDYFAVTPQDFISNWNSLVSDFQKRDKTEVAQSLILIPDFVESGKEIKMGEYLDIEFETNSDGYIERIVIGNNKKASKEELITFGFMMGGLPGVMNPGTTLDLADEIEKNYGYNIYDGEICYIYLMGDFGVEVLAISVK